MPKLINLAKSLRIIRTFENTISTVIIGKSCDTNLNTFIGGILHKTSLRTDLNAWMSCRIGICLWYDSVLTLISAYSGEIICKSICCIRIAWCHAFSCDILPVWVGCRGTYVNTHCGQWITPIFCGFCATVVTSLYTLLRNLAAKVSIRACVRTSFGEWICINGLISGTDSYTQSGQVIGIWIYRTLLDTLVSRVVSPILFRTCFHAPSSCLISITEIWSWNRHVCCHIGASTYTLSCWRIGKVPWCLTIKLAHSVLVIVIGQWGTSKHTFVSWIISAWIAAGVTNVHANSVAVVGEWINAVIHTSMSPVICVKGRNTSWIADSCVGISVKPCGTYTNTNSFIACLVKKSISISMNRTYRYTDSCRRVSITLRTDTLTDGTCSVVKPKRSQRTLESTSISRTISRVECCVCTYTLALSRLRITIVLCTCECLAYFNA